MAINKATLIKQSPTDGTIHYIYPKTTADLVLYNNGKSLEDKINEIESVITNNDATISTKGLMSADDKKALIGLHEVNSGNPILIAAIDSDNQDIADPTTAATIYGDLLYNGTTCMADLNIEMNKDCKELTIYFNNMGTNMIFNNSIDRILDSGYTFYNINLQTGYDLNNDGDTDDEDETEYQTISAACPYKVIVYAHTNDSNIAGNCIKIISEDNALYNGAIVKVSFTAKLYSGSTTSVQL